ncbi:glycosyltransferase family 2 protein [Alkalimarinus sediminis]|uniref:Glycosyltransferase n=1 Tax=Alkalimarinus sediminis TaxID=1632866 RepID=A0A9E8HK64_9ALTE|nr:glycosyltransferase [Alkalimarinus sediminis]UZW76155.1 glycosyltransferase [Alkalimarinus sediminis]
MKFSIVILTYNRPNSLANLLTHLEEVMVAGVEVIVVDNNSVNVNWSQFKNKYPLVEFIHLGENVGVGGRNEGIRRAQGQYVITLDDDIVGINLIDLNVIEQHFNDISELGALCFKVLDQKNKSIVNWIHHCKPEIYAEKVFQTYEITEGAVVFKKSALKKAGLYPEEFFISHEGTDLAFRLMDAGYSVYYSPDIIVEHEHALAGRPSWRRYYYDTRNSIWLAIRNYDLELIIKRLPIALISMLIYSIRDGYFKFWVKGVYDALKAFGEANKNRTRMKACVKKEIKCIDKMRPSTFYMIKKRLFTRKVRI